MGLMMGSVERIDNQTTVAVWVLAMMIECTQFGEDSQQSPTHPNFV